MTGILTWIVGGVSVVIGMFLGRWLNRADAERAGRNDAYREALRDEKERADAGRKAVAEGRDAGTPDDRLRRNDGSWQ